MRNVNNLKFAGCFPDDMTAASKKNAAFLAVWFGGRPGTRGVLDIL